MKSVSTGTHREQPLVLVDEATKVLEGKPSDDRVMRMLAAQEPKNSRLLERHGRSNDDRFVLAAALVVLGTSYAATEKLVTDLRLRGLFEQPPRLSFDTHK